MRLECQVFLFWFSQDLLFCSCCVQKRDGERNSLQNLQNQELLIHKPPGDISVRCPGSVSSGVKAAVTALHYSAALSDYSAVTGFLSRLKWSCLAIKISQPSNSYQPALLLGWDPSPPQIRRGQVGGRNTVGLSVYLPSPSDVQIHQDARVSEWILGFSRERAEIAEFIPARPGYISDNAVTLGLSCNFLEDEARCDRWRSWWKSCRGRGHVALPSNLRRDRSERGHEEGPAATSTFPFLALFAKKKQKTTARHVRKTSGQRRKFSICKISSVFTLSCCQLVFCRWNDSDSSFNQTYRFGWKWLQIQKCVSNSLSMLENMNCEEIYGCERDEWNETASLKLHQSLFGH